MVRTKHYSPLVLLISNMKQSRSSRSSLAIRIPYTSPRAVGQPDCLPDDRHIRPQHCSSRHRRYPPSSPVGPACISKCDYGILSSFEGLGPPFDRADTLKHRAAGINGEEHDGEGSITGLQQRCHRCAHQGRDMLWASSPRVGARCPPSIRHGHHSKRHGWNCCHQARLGSHLGACAPLL